MVYPKSFLLLAGSGVLAKSIGKGMGKPSFRVIQQHFSRANNVGDVAAKEEVWRQGQGETGTEERRGYGYGRKGMGPR